MQNHRSFGIVHSFSQISHQVKHVLNCIQVPYPVARKDKPFLGEHLSFS